MLKPDKSLSGITQPHPHCEKCKVRWKNCGLKPETCSKIYYPISDKEIEFILQMNENLPTDEMELQVKDMLVMEVRERHSSSQAPERIPVTEAKYPVHIAGAGYFTIAQAMNFLAKNCSYAAPGTRKRNKECCGDCPSCPGGIYNSCEDQINPDSVRP